MHSVFDEVYKFGGTSLKNAQCIARAVNIVQKAPSVVVVLSAMAGVSDWLEQALDYSVLKKDTTPIIEKIRLHHIKAAEALFAETSSFVLEMNLWLTQTSACLAQIAKQGSYNVNERAQVLGVGERLSVRLFSLALGAYRSACFIDADTFLCIQEDSLSHACDWDRSLTLWSDLCADHAVTTLVVTGFLVQDAHGQVAVLERNGSDVSASYIARLCQAKKLVIWSDQDGIYSANPDHVPLAFPIEQLCYEEALELAYFGTKIIHPLMIAPAMNDAREIWVKNSFNPDASGTQIHAQVSSKGSPVVGLSSLGAMAMITLTGASMIGVSGVAARTFQAMKDLNISVVLISQASSEHSICFCVHQECVQEAVAHLKDVFAQALDGGAIASIQSRQGVSIVAVVGEKMRGLLGVAGKMCQTLANAQVNIEAIAQGSSERNISVVIDSIDEKKALRALHGGFYLSNKTLVMALVGVGVIGSELICQIKTYKDQLYQDSGVVLVVRAIMNSKSMLLSERGVDLEHWEEALAGSAQKADMNRLLEHMATDEFPHAVMVDCTSSESIADYYERCLHLGLHVVTPNKKAGSGDWRRYENILRAVAFSRKKFLYETTVCAGLPVISTLQDIIKTGDRVDSIHGVVSGSLSFIFNRINEGMRFSEAVHLAKTQGYTEPDPRDDLSGLDVVRKMVCLSRELGFRMSIEDVSCMSLVPDELKNCSLDEFLSRLNDFDDHMQERLQAASQGLPKLIYAGEISSDGQVQVALKGVADDHPMASLCGTDNMIVFKTKRYHEQPLVVRGPGAGAEVTAAGVFADLLRLVSWIGEKDWVV